jgi:leucyl-tRNA synthetase
MTQIDTLDDSVAGTNLSIDVLHAIELKWRQKWLRDKTFRTPTPDAETETFYCLDMFPYPSGDGLHVGHPVGFVASDIVSRFKRMKGLNVLHPMGWDAFGLPAERHAMKTGQHPSVTVRKNAANYRRQMEMVGLSYDWDREIFTSDPKYYKNTQKMFLDLYQAWFDPETQRARPISELPIPPEIRDAGYLEVKRFQNDHRLAYYDKAMVNFCPELGCVVANEEVMADGRTEQGYEVVRQRQRQVKMRISAFSERLLAGLEDLDWPQAIKEQQRAWIGRSNGHKITFVLESGHEIPVFTTRADTLPGVTFLAIAPEHPLVEEITTPAQRFEVQTYVQEALQKSELSRKQSNEKSGARTGALARNPLTGEVVPVFVADYVLLESGTGAVMGVPAHDIRDFEFAALFGLPVIPVLAPDGEERGDVVAGRKCWPSDGIALGFDLECYSELQLAGKASPEFTKRLCEHLESRGIATKSVQYRIRDWIFSRERYWGEPIPLIHLEDGTVSAVPREDLPVVLPPLDDYSPSRSGEPPLSRATEWVKYTDPKTGQTGKREVLTMPQWAGSCWYALRFMDPRNDTMAVDPEIERRWGPVDLYIGGAEHATLHLLYARFWYIALSDLGCIQTIEPFSKLVNQGLLLSFSFRNDRGVLIPVDEVEQRDDGRYFVSSNSPHYSANQADIPLERIRAKMSKSLRNVVTPDQVIESYGADAYRVCLMFMGPVEQIREWEDSKAAASLKFLRRFWRFVTDENESGIRQTMSADQEDADIKQIVSKTVSTIEFGIETLRLNTPIAAFMKCLNEIGTRPVSIETLEQLVLILSPFAPFVCEELWSRLGHETSLAREPWPNTDTMDRSVPDVVPVVVTVDGKKRANLEIPSAVEDSALKERALAAVEGRWNVSGDFVKALVIRDKASGAPKLVNIVTRRI